MNNDVDWAGHKAVNGKMLKGMYPTADRDIKMQVNPQGVVLSVETNAQS